MVVAIDVDGRNKGLDVARSVKLSNCVDSGSFDNGQGKLCILKHLQHFHIASSTACLGPRRLNAGSGLRIGFHRVPFVQGSRRLSLCDTELLNATVGKSGRRRLALDQCGRPTRESVLSRSVRHGVCDGGHGTLVSHMQHGGAGARDVDGGSDSRRGLGVAAAPSMAMPGADHPLLVMKAKRGKPVGNAR